MNHTLTKTEQRQVDVLVDGKRTVADIMALLPKLDPWAVAYYGGATGRELAACNLPQE